MLKRRGARKRQPPPARLEANALLEAALDYAKWAKGHPIVVSRIVGGERVEECHDRPLTFEGFITHGRIDPGLIETTRANAPGVLAAIRALFFDQQYSRAAIGEYDRRLVAAYFGLAERRQVEASVTVTNLTDEELDAELADLLEVVDVPTPARIASGNGSRSLEGEETKPSLPVIRD
jgi:hypothetical protein